MNMIHIASTTVLEHELPHFCVVNRKKGMNPNGVQLMKFFIHIEAR